MTAQDRPFVRVYYEIIDDPKFATVYGDDRKLATWLRLLIAADAMHPAPAPVARSVHEPTFRHLVQVGLIEPVGADHFRVHGLRSERDNRYAGGKGRRKYPSDSDSDSESDPESEPIPVRSTLTSLSNPDLTGPDQPSPVGDDLWKLYGALTHTIARKPTVLDWLDRIEGAYGFAESARALQEEHAKDGNPGTLLSRVNQRLEQAARKAEVEASHDKRTSRIVNGMMERRLEEYRFTGKWHEEWGPMPEGVA